MFERQGEITPPCGGDRRVKDGVIRRMIDKWLKAGVLEDGLLRSATSFRADIGFTELLMSRGSEAIPST
jgi:hypothetical protein